MSLVNGESIVVQLRKDFLKRINGQTLTKSHCVPTSFTVLSGTIYIGRKQFKKKPRAVGTEDQGFRVKHLGKMFCTYGTNKIIIHSSSTDILPLRGS